MKAALLALLLCLACAVPSQAAAPGARQALDQFIDAFNNLDWPRFSAALDDEVTVFNPDIPEAPGLHRLDGRAQVEEGFRKVFEATRSQAAGPPYLHIVPRELRIQQYGDVALASFEFQRDGASYGRRTIVFRHRLDGWKIVHIHASNVGKAN